MAVLITGGARSGKSSFAEQYALRCAERGVYIATCQPYDSEMKERIGRHRQLRQASGFAWETVEEPYEAAAFLTNMAKQPAQETSGEGNLDKQAAAADTVNEAGANASVRPPAVLLDCVTLWLTNWMLLTEQADCAEEQLEAEIRRLLAAIEAYPHPLLIVTNEVGDGIVPDYPLGRRFRDEAGRLNQRIAAICDRVFLVTAGIPVELKSQAFRWEQL